MVFSLVLLRLRALAPSVIIAHQYVHCATIAAFCGVLPKKWLSCLHRAARPQPSKHALISHAVACWFVGACHGTALVQRRIPQAPHSFHSLAPSGCRHATTTAQKQRGWSGCSGPRREQRGVGDTRTHSLHSHSHLTSIAHTHSGAQRENGRTDAPPKLFVVRFEIRPQRS